MKKVVITGASGMIGVALTEECIARGCEVLALVRGGSPNNSRIPQSPLVRVVECGLEELHSFDFSERGFDAFYHLGWSGTSPEKRKDPAEQQKNVQYTLDAVRLAKKLGCKKFIGAGSQAEYGPKNLERISPDTPTAPVTAYGEAKLAAGNAARSECAALGLNCIWVRIFSVYGRYDLPTTMISSTLAALSRGEKPRFTPAEQLWDYLECSDAARALYLVGDKSEGEKIYCLGSGNARPLREYIEQLRDIAAPGAALGIGEIPYPQGAVMSLCADISPLTRDTGFEPRVSFSEGIGKLIRWTKY